MSGWIKLHRKITECPYWTEEPFTRGQAWVDMLILANRCDGFVRKQGVRVDLNRGDLGWSETELSDRWKWSRGKTRRFFSELEKDLMIHRKNASETDRRKFIVTITNYDKYQLDDTGDDTGDDTSDGQATGRRRYKNKKEEKYKKEENKKTNRENGQVNGFDFDSLPKEIAREVVVAFIEHRKAIGKKLTQFALKLNCENAIKVHQSHGIDPNEAIKHTIAKGWIACDPKYFDGKSGNAKAQPKSFSEIDYGQGGKL